MNITNCVKCGGNVRSETIGWICENCKGFIDMDGNYHPHVEKPFMPPMTNGDRIRAMTDEELAKRGVRQARAFVDNGQSGRYEDAWETSDGSIFWTEQLAVEFELNWLKQPAEDD